MQQDAYIAISLICFSLAMFIWGKVRYDIVALMALMAGVVFGIVPAQGAFNGFGHPAVITVIAVLIISVALNNSGIVGYISGAIKPFKRFATLQIFVLTFIVAALSGFMNNVGALALMLPVALQQAALTNRSPSSMLMPISFGSLLGGLTTLIGTPPNIIIANFRTDQLGAPFGMFDFAPVGAGIAVVGVLFISFIGWRLVPKRKDPDAVNQDLFELKGYIIEAHIPEESELVGQLIREVEQVTTGGTTIVGMIRKERKILAPSGFVPVQADDILLMEGDPSSLTKLLDNGDIELDKTEHDTDSIRDDDVEVLEAVVPPGARIEGATARSMRLRSRYGVNLLAVAHQGRTILERLGRIRFAAGDVLLLQGEPKSLREALGGLGCLPLATRELNLDKRKTPWPLLIFIGAILLAAFDYLPVQISFVIAVLMIILFGFLSIRDVYESIEWPVIILLGGMIPIGQALQDTGATAEIAQLVMVYGQDLTPITLMVALMVVTMMLSDVINNAVTAVVMAPIALSLAQGLGVSPDAYLMAVAVASSSTYLTPIGHQCNTLVMAPGGYKFSDYWRMGLPLDMIIIAVSVPLISYFWPL